MLTPIELQVLLDVNLKTSPVAFNDVYEDAVQRFITDDIVDFALDSLETERRLDVTDKGNAWLQVILSTPMPEQVWVDGNGKVIKPENQG